MNIHTYVCIYGRTIPSKRRRHNRGWMEKITEAFCPRGWPFVKRKIFPKWRRKKVAKATLFDFYSVMYGQNGDRDTCVCVCK